MWERIKYWFLNLWRKLKPMTMKHVIKEEELSIDWNFRFMIVEMAKKDLNLRETKGKNRDPIIDEINKMMGLPMGSPYCLSAIWVRCIKWLCDYMEIYNPVPKTGSTQTFWEKAPKKYKRVRGEKARKGDVGILRNRKDPKRGHAFLFIEDETNVQQTLEYNTNLKGSADGEGAYQLTRVQAGTLSHEYLGAVDVISWVIDENPEFFELNEGITR